MNNTYNIVASTDTLKGSVGHWDVEIANEQLIARCQDTIVNTMGVYGGGIWFQNTEALKPTDEEVSIRLLALTD